MCLEARMMVLKGLTCRYSAHWPAQLSVISQNRLTCSGTPIHHPEYADRLRIVTIMTVMV